DSPAGVKPFNYVHIPHTAALLTGTPAARGKVTDGFGWGQGPSVDQFVAQQTRGATPLPSLELHAIRGKDSATTQTRICYRRPDQPVTGERDPRLALQRIVEGSRGGTGSDLDLRRLGSERRSVLDFVNADLARLRSRVGREDLVRLDGHQTSLRELEAQL